jgi:hypothetical protein
VGRLSAASVHLVSRFRLSDRASSRKGALTVSTCFGRFLQQKPQLTSRESSMKSKQWNECRRSEYKRGGTPGGMQSLRRRVGGFEFSSAAISKKILWKCSKYALWIGRAFVGQWTVEALFFLFFPVFGGGGGWGGAGVSWRIPSTSLLPHMLWQILPSFHLYSVVKLCTAK